ncbi:MAG: hypothetical protein HY922_02815 [Elusimicrobia bacterium]|nr:hypothetical protein [Elusimicrobiota bacterium]
MDISQVVEQLSFGKSVPKMPSCLGLFLSPDMIFLTEVRYSDGKVQVSHLLRIPIPAGPPSKETKTGGSLNTDFLADSERVSGIIRKEMENFKWGSRFVMVTLSHHFGILRYFILPGIDRRFWKMAIPAEAKKYIPINFATLVNDFQVIPVPPGPDKRPKFGSLFGVTPRRNLDSIRELVAKLGLQLVGVELAPVSTERLWDCVERVGNPYAQVHFDGGEVRILISDGGLPIFYREIFLSPDATAAEIRKIDLSGCVDFTKKQLSSKGPDKIRLSGQTGDLAGWQAAFAQETGLQTALMETDKLLGLKGGRWGGYAAIGAALRHLAPTPLMLDLSGVGRVSDDDRRTAMTIFKLSAAVAAVLLALGGYRHTLLSMKQGEFAKLRSQVDVLKEFEGKTAEQIEQAISQMREKVNSFGTITAKQVPLTHILQAIAETIPNQAWITDLIYENPITIAEKQAARVLKLKGSVFGNSPAAEQDIAFRFADTLRKNEIFSKAFKSIDPSVHKKEAEGGAGAGAMNPSEANENLEKRTQFDIDCSNVRKL